MRTCPASDELAAAIESWGRDFGDGMDPRNLKTHELLMLLNSTPAGEVLNRWQLDRDRARGGTRFVQGSRYDLFRYLAFLYDEAHKPAPVAAAPADPYLAHAERVRARQEQQSKSGRDMGEVPPPRHPRAKEKARFNLAFFLKAWFPKTFRLPWSKDHLLYIKRIEKVVLRGGMLSVGMMRGGGKTVIAECAVIWAILFGHVSYAAIIGPDEGHAINRLKTIKTQLEGNPRLLADFPEVCIPIRELAGINQRKPLYRGEPIKMEFKQTQIILPNIPPNPASDAIIGTAGITGQIRGLNFTRPGDLKPVRPQFIILDDPQTDETARSKKQTQDRIDTINGTILGLAGPGEKMGVLMTCTVIKSGDLSDHYLNEEKNPEWRPIRTKMMLSFPKNEAKWQEYMDVRLAGIREDDDHGERGNVFLRSNWEEMHAGASVSWPERIDPGDLSAVQSAMNVKLRNPLLFYAEYQNDPGALEDKTAGLQTAEAIAARVNRYPRSTAPRNSQHLTAFVDVGKGCLWYAVCAWDMAFTGGVIDYGTFPDQRKPIFFKSALDYTIEDAFSKADKQGGFEAALTWALNELWGKILPREWLADDGTALRIQRCLVDYGWGDYSDVVIEACRQSAYASVLMPSHGRGIGPTDNPMSTWQCKPGERQGLNWHIRRKAGSIRTITFDSNFWKTFVHERLATEPGDPGALQLFGDDEEFHLPFASHLISEHRNWVEAKTKGRALWVWSERAERPDNDWFDAVVGCAVGASMLGSKVVGRVKKKRVPIEVDWG